MSAAASGRMPGVIIVAPPTITLREAEQESRKPGWRQCTSVYRGAASFVFCIRCTKHEGDHRGGGKQWRDA